MGNKKSREIECLLRLAQTTTPFQEILNFLVEEKLIARDEGNKVLASASVAKELHILLQNLSTSGKFQMLEYAWKVLPAEEIELTIVTDNRKIEFTYNSF